MRQLFAAMILACCLPLAALGQVNSHLKEEFQGDEKHGVRVVENVGQIRDALHDDTVRILSMQVFGEEIPPETHQELLDWVRSGKSLWFYDVRLAPQFGMKPYLLLPEQFRNKPEDGVLGGSKRAGLATTAVSFGQHAVQTGVGQVTVFLPELETEQKDVFNYGAVEVAGDTVPLLQFELDSPALIALRREGRGLIVFKDLLWNEPLSGDRFQLNLLDYSAGFQVPGPAGEGKVGSPPGPDAEYVTGDPAVPLAPGSASSVPAAHLPPVVSHANDTEAAKGAWTLELKDGTRLTGELEGEVLQFETSSESLKLKPEEVTSIEFGSSIKLDKLVTAKGKTQSGLFMSSPLKFRTDRGVEEFEKEDLQLLEHEVAPKESEKP
jgi:hypothetical protein